MLLPLFNQVGEVQLEGVDYEPTELLSGREKLLRIKSSVQIGTTTIESVLWTNRQGETLKSLLPGLEQVSYRTTKEAGALPRRNGRATLTLEKTRWLRCRPSGARPRDASASAYRAHLAVGDPAQDFPAGWTQLVRKTDDHSAEIVVRAVRPDSGPDGFPDDAPPTDAEREANNFLQSDDPEVQAMAQTVAPNESDPWVVACAMERFVRDTVRTKDFSPAVATAADVARSREGDCTEHAVLLAALCRARGIPARVAIGLVYYPPAQGFAYHMWTESWIAGHWIPLDATLGLGGIGGAHLKISHSSLEGTESLSAFLPVFKLLGQLKLEVVSVDETSQSPKTVQP